MMLHNYNLYKKVLLRERKRLTVRRVASTRHAVCVEGTPSPPPRPDLGPGQGGTPSCWWGEGVTRVTPPRPDLRMRVVIRETRPACIFQVYWRMSLTFTDFIQFLLKKSEPRMKNDQIWKCKKTLLKRQIGTDTEERLYGALFAVQNISDKMEHSTFCRTC